MPWAGWGTPVNLPPPPNLPNDPLPFESLKFNQVGLFDLRRRLGVFPSSHGTFTRFQSKFLASDVAWFAAGTHNDGSHTVPPAQFHPIFKTAREGATTYEERTNLRKRVLDLLFDLATFSDRAFGGCTMVLHVDGTLVPNAPPLPEYIKADVYLPPPFVEENIVSSFSVAMIVQKFIEDIAVPAVIRWKQAAANTPGIRWKFNDGGVADIPAPNRLNLPLIPSPITTASSRRIFFGRTSGSLTPVAPDAFLDSPRTPLSSALSSSPFVTTDDNDDVQQMLADLREEIVVLKAALSSASQEEQDSQQMITSLRGEIRKLTFRLSAALSGSGASQSRHPPPPIFKEEHVDQSPRPLSPSKALRGKCPTPASPTVQAPVPGNIFQLGASPKMSSPSVSRHHSPIRSFGPESAKVISHHSLSHRVHTTLTHLCNEFTMDTWATELSKIYPDDVVSDLVVAMEADTDPRTRNYHQWPGSALCLPVTERLERYPFRCNPEYHVTPPGPILRRDQVSRDYSFFIIILNITSLREAGFSAVIASHNGTIQTIPFSSYLQISCHSAVLLSVDMARALTVKATNVRHPRRRQKQAPLTAHQRALKIASRAERQGNIQQAVSEWYSATLLRAEQLAIMFHKKPRYFLDLFFQGGTRMIQKRNRVNPWNAWNSLQAKRVNAETEIGEATHLTEIQQSNKAGYEALTAEEKKALVEEFLGQPEKPVRTTARSRILDVTNVVKNMESLMTGLNKRVGIEGFFCIVRSATNFHMEPQWYFTSSELCDYMQIAVRRQWNIGDVGAKLEAFAIAGCDVGNLLSNSKKKADYIKGQIRDRINAMLAEITGRPNIVMQYINYERAIVLRLGVDLRGWTHPTWANPSELSTSLPPLQALLDAIKNGSCKFVRLTREELRAREGEYYRKVQAGEIKGGMRKKRKDAGKKRSASNKENLVEEEEESSDNE